jgi:galactokinase
MYPLDTLKEMIRAGRFDSVFSTIYANDSEVLEAQHQRYLEAVDAFHEIFPDAKEALLFSAPGRTEVGGNHTDHQHGAVLAAAVNLDVIAVMCPNDSGVIRVKSKGFPLDTVDLAVLTPQEEELGHSPALIRGVAARMKELDCGIGGFDAYTTSNVLKGSGLSSSAAFENLIGTMLNAVYNENKLNAVEIAQISQYAEVHFFGKACGLMDQMASSVGGFSSMDFRDPSKPVIKKIDFDFASCGYSLCIVDTKGNHADLTPEYVAVPVEMKSVAAQFGKEVLRDVDPEEFYAKIGDLRGKVSDRAIVRAMHFFNDNQTALDEAKALQEGDFETFKALIQASGNSSFKYLQNVFPASHPEEQGLSVGLGVSERVLKGRGVCRVHGGGFAGTIQAFVPNDLVDTYREALNGVFGEGSCYVLKIRPLGGIQITE